MEDIISAERVIGFDEKDKVKNFQFKISCLKNTACYNPNNKKRERNF